VAQKRVDVGLWRLRCRGDSAMIELPVKGSLESFVTDHSQEFGQVKQLLAGGVAGCAAKTVVAPLSRVTMLMQVQSMRPHKFADGMHPNNRYMLESVKKIYAEEGLLAFWRGNAAMMVHRFPYTAITFWGRQVMDDHITTRCRAVMPDNVRSFISASTSAAIACIACYPLDLVKTRLTVQTKTKYYHGVVDALTKIVRDEGPRGIYRGLPPTLCSVVPMIGLNFACYDHFFLLYGDLGVQPVVHSFLAGGTSGALVSVLLFPVDLVRRQMQMVGFGGRPQVYGSVFEAVRQVFATGYNFDHSHGNWRRTASGFREFFRGLAPELVKATPMNAVMFCVHYQLLNRVWPYERPPNETR